ncbi:MAG: hypothetical protein EOL98_04715 [Negativicutes bacterium]|nr:hypothetical protein [Negativicutes bacterium]
MKTHKGPTITIGILLIACLALLVRGVVWYPFCLFSGAKLFVLLALISIWAKQFGGTSTLQRILVSGGEICALLVGSHLLVPYFWPTRIYNGQYLTAFMICAGLAWLYSMASLEKEEFGSRSFQLFFYAPLVVFIGLALAVSAFAGPANSAKIFVFYYFVLGGVIVKEGLLDNKSGKLNGGLLLMIMATAGAAIVFNLSQLLNWKITTGVACAFVFINIWFNARKRRMRRRNK